MYVYLILGEVTIGYVLPSTYSNFFLQYPLINKLFKYKLNDIP